MYMYICVYISTGRIICLVTPLWLSMFVVMCHVIYHQRRLMWVSMMTCKSIVALTRGFAIFNKITHQTLEVFNIFS